MICQRLPLPKIATGRPPKYPSAAKLAPAPRSFTQNSRLLLVTGVGPRPHLPFLHCATGGRSVPIVPRNAVRYQLSRLITTERKLYLKDQIWRGAKYTVYGWAGLILLATMTFGVKSEIAQRRFPSPEEWTFRTRINYGRAKSAENPDLDETAFVDWSHVGQSYIQLIERLEDPTIDGQGLQPILHEDGDIYIAGLGKAGLDISLKSEPWRRGYHECLMGVAKAAENRDGWLRDTTRNTDFPPEHVVGPSNPRPKPVPFGAPVAPLEKDCVPAFEPAEIYYMKILTTHGFSSRQRLDTALAYADWLDFKGLSSTAEDMYDWGLDIAMGSLPEGVSDVVDIKTGVITSQTTHVSSNILLATTSLAIHHARNNNLATALPIFLSVLRARRQLSDPAPSIKTDRKPQDQSLLDATVSLFKHLVVPPPYPPAPPTGDEVPTRTSTAVCEEARVMSHIGEILFASSTTNSSDASRSIPSPSSTSIHDHQIQQSGLSWTREAVDLAETTLVSAADTDDLEARERCSECLAVSMDNWSTMVSRMLKNERLSAESGASQKRAGTWFWGSGSEFEGEARWERERKLVDERFGRVQRLLSQEADRKKTGSLGFFFM